MERKSYVMNESWDVVMYCGELFLFNVLCVFDVVVWYGSFVGVVVELYVIYWVVGKQIWLLEDWFGLLLFDWCLCGVVLIDEGVVLLNDVSYVFECFGIVVVWLCYNMFMQWILGVVCVNVLMSFVFCWLLLWFVDFYVWYFDIDVRVLMILCKLCYVVDVFDIGVCFGFE